MMVAIAAFLFGSLQLLQVVLLLPPCPLLQLYGFVGKWSKGVIPLFFFLISIIVAKMLVLLVWEVIA